MGLENITTDAGLGVEQVEMMLQRTDKDVGWLPANADEHRFDMALARAATRLAVTRHAGWHETVYSATGPVTLQHGKDLNEIDTIIGTGGVLVHNETPQSILSAALAGDDAPLALRPQRAQFILDRKYALYACGLLAGVAPDDALRLGLKMLRKGG
jgi:uncharacterized protein (TIGR01319 family)